MAHHQKLPPYTSSKEIGTKAASCQATPAKKVHVVAYPLTEVAERIRGEMCKDLIGETGCFQLTDRL